MLTSTVKCCHTAEVPSSPGERLEALMKAAGHTRKSLAAAVQVHPNALSGWIAGRYTPRDPAVRERLTAELGEDVYGTWVDLGDGRTVVRLQDIPQQEFADEVVRRLCVNATKDPFVINDSEGIRNTSDDGNTDDRAGGAQA